MIEVRICKQGSLAPLRLFYAVLLLSLWSCHFCAYALSDVDVEQELTRVGQLLKSDPQQARSALEDLESNQAQFSPPQALRLKLLKASVLGFFNQHQERVTYLNGFIDSVQDPNSKTIILYQLSVSYAALGDYERALEAMNANIVLLPRVTDTIAKITTLQAAVTLLNSLHAYNEALSYANRMFDLPVPDNYMAAKCFASEDRVEIYMLLNQRALAQSQMREAVELCDKNGATYASLIVKALVAIDLIDHQEYQNGIDAGLPALKAFPSSMPGVDYVSRLEEALARAYLKIGRLAVAEQFGLQAYQHAESQKLVQPIEKSLETLAQIKHAQGQYAAALGYAEQALVQKNTLLDEQLQKNIAYQHVKFGAQDQSNQVALLEKQNKILAIEEELDKKNGQNSWLITALATIVAAALGLYLWKVIQQKNFFHRKTQIDGLTHISNRGHFMTSTENVVNVPDQLVSLIVFDMDHFKRVNDSFGHPVGDWVLTTVCKTISAELRPLDLFGRIGGEEFAICLPNTDTPVAVRLAQRCRAAIAAIDTGPCGFKFSLSASFGVATIGQYGGRDFVKLLETADKALYRAKSDGRNCVST
jgi:diguanylate cyclase (GGDEF)-like protein